MTTSTLPSADAPTALGIYAVTDPPWLGTPQGQRAAALCTRYIIARPMPEWPQA